MDLKQVDPREVFARLNGNSDLPGFDSTPRLTDGGNAYLVAPGVVLIARPLVMSHHMSGFLTGFPVELGFGEYLHDGAIGNGGEEGADLVKLAGQLCYMSFGPGRTRNAEAQKYINNILSSGHGSTLEHAQYSFLLYGAGRDFTHELVRHRTGVAFSQVSQRYVDGKVLRFVERPEYQNDPELHDKFLARIDQTAATYDDLARILAAKQASGDVALSSEKKTEMRKKVNQAARSALTNEVEAPIMFSGNIRALRHVCEMRAAGAADVPIRGVTTRIFLCMQHEEPTLFNDYKLYELPDGTHAVATDWRKV